MVKARSSYLHAARNLIEEIAAVLGARLKQEIAFLVKFEGQHAARFLRDALAEGKSNRLVAYQNGEFCDFDIEEALRMQKEIPEYQLELSAKLTR